MKEKIFDELVLMSVSFGQKPELERLKIYVEDLSEFNFEDTIKAIRQIRRTAKFFPQLAEIIELIKSGGVPSEELAISISNEVVEAISRFGNYQIKEARAHLGEDKWGIVERAGGWTEICKIEYSHLETFKAQLRDLSKSYINRSKREFMGGEFKINSSPVQIGNSNLKRLEF